MQQQLLRGGLFEDRHGGETRCNVLRRNDKAHSRHSSLGFAKAHTNGFVRRCGRCGLCPVFTDDRQPHPLPDLHPGLQHIGPGQLQRPHIGLVRCVGPVALVLHFKRVAFHPAFGDNARHDLMRDGAHVLEGLPWVDEIRKPRLDGFAIDVFDGDGRTGEACYRMQHAEATAVGEEVQVAAAQ